MEVDWSNISGIIMALLVAIGLPLALKKRKKAAPQSREELSRHLQQIGVEASLVERGSEKEKIGLGRASGQKSQGIIELTDRSIDSINVISVASQYGVHFCLDYLVKSPNIAGRRILKKTTLARKRSPPLFGKVSGIEWKGDRLLAQSLNLDYSLEEKLLQAGPEALNKGIRIFPEPRHGYVRIRTTYLPPSKQMFQAIAIVAKHVRSY